MAKKPFVALVSGGKDSIYSAKLAVEAGFELVALANLYPVERDELDSYMFQTIGHEMIERIAEAMEVPLIREPILGTSKDTDKLDIQNLGDDDEISDLQRLLEKCQKQFPEIRYVCCGAILSNYQRNRVEFICRNLGLISIAPLWQRDQEDYVQELVREKLEVVLSKVASYGLCPEKDVGKTLAVMEPKLLQLSRDFGIHAAGEGGEFESLVLYCPGLYKKRIVIEESRVIPDEESRDVAYLKVSKSRLEPLSADDLSISKMKISECNAGAKIVKEAKFAVETHKSWDQVYPASVHVFDSSSVAVIANIYAVRLPGVGQESGNEADLDSGIDLAFLHLQSNLQTLDLGIEDIAMVRLYLSDVSTYAAINNKYKVFFGQHSPARICVEVPYSKRVIFTMEVVARKNNTSRKTVHVESQSYWAPAMIGPYSQAVAFEDFAFISGMIGLEPMNMQMAESESDQHRLASSHVEAVKDVLSPKFTKLLSMEYNTNPRPENIGVSNLPKDAVVEIEEFICTNEFREPELRRFETVTDFVRYVTSIDQNQECAVRVFIGAAEDISPVCRDLLMNKTLLRNKCLSYVPSTSTDVVAVTYYF